MTLSDFKVIGYRVRAVIFSLVTLEIKLLGETSCHEYTHRRGITVGSIGGFHQCYKNWLLALEN